MLNSKVWGVWTIILTAVSVISISVATIIIDPYFHYHKPASNLYYELRKERYVNNGILRHFDYNAIIVGTCMTENFSNSEFERLFGVESVKTPLQGASYREINQYIEMAIRYNPKVKLVVRGLESDYITDDPSLMNYPDYPYYLYDDDYLNDIRYLLSIDVIKSIALNVYKTIIYGGGVESFDQYSYWGDKVKYGKAVVREHVAEVAEREPEKRHYLSDSEKTTIIENVDKNIVELAKANPNIDFYYFITPYSIAYWYKLYVQGDIDKHIDAEKLMITKILECGNIHLYSFNNEYNIITDLNNYTDAVHYGSWINSDILEWMKDGHDLITKDNYINYINAERDFYVNYDYNHLWD